MVAAFPRVLWRVARILFITHQVSCSCTRDEGFSWVSEMGLWEFKETNGVKLLWLKKFAFSQTWWRHQCFRFEMVNDAPDSSEGSECYDADDARPTFVWGTNISDVFDYDPILYAKMVRYPLEVLAIFDIVLMIMVGRINPLYYEKHIQTRIFNH